MSGPKPFDHDVARDQSYQYTSHKWYSAQVANQRLTEVTLKLLSKKPKTILDIGCGDGAYTAELTALRSTWKLSGFDPAAQAIALAQKKHPHIKFWVDDLLKPKHAKKTQAALLRGVIHHLPNPALGIQQAAYLAETLLIIEPNGHNPIVKLLEKFSPYHRDHHEQSFTTTQLRQWLTQANCIVTYATYVGLVPFFCPTPFAMLLKLLEPILENTWLAKWLCGQQILVAKRVQANTSRPTA